MFVNVIVDDPVRVAVERACSSASLVQKAGLLDRRWKSLASLDKVSTALMVESARGSGIGVDGVNGQDIANVLLQLNERFSTNTVGTVNVERRERPIALFGFVSNYSLQEEGR